MKEELVVLIDEQNNEIGVAQKDTVHTKDTPLHRAFSLFIFNSKNELLITKRAEIKKHLLVCGRIHFVDTLRQMKQLSMRQKGD